MSKMKDIATLEAENELLRKLIVIADECVEAGEGVGILHYVEYIEGIESECYRALYNIINFAKQEEEPVEPSDNDNEAGFNPYTGGFDPDLV